MPETSRGIVYPASDAHTRLWEHFQSMANTTNDAITAAIAAAAPIDSGGVAVPYASGYKASGTALRIRKIGKVVHLTGTVTNTANSMPVNTGGVDVATIPAAFLPDDAMRELWLASSQNPGASMARGYITTTGALRIYTYTAATPYVDCSYTYFTN